MMSNEESKINQELQQNGVIETSSEETTANINTQLSIDRQAQFILSLVNTEQQIHLTQQDGVFVVMLPPEKKGNLNQWQQTIDEFKYRLQGMEKSWQPQTQVHLQAEDRLLDSRQLQNIAAILAEVSLELGLVITRRRQTAVAAASVGYSVQQNSPNSLLIPDSESKSEELMPPLYLKKTIRSGKEIRHSGTVIILGDVNPGGTIIAAGDVFIWGVLRGLAHAGARGNRQSTIMALRMEPTQLRIAEFVARVSDNPLENLTPEVAYISEQGIKITSAFNFAKTNFFTQKVNSFSKSCS